MKVDKRATLQVFIASAWRRKNERKHKSLNKNRNQKKEKWSSIEKKICSSMKSEEPRRGTIYKKIRKPSSSASFAVTGLLVTIAFISHKNGNLYLNLQTNFVSTIRIYRNQNNPPAEFFQDSQWYRWYFCSECGHGDVVHRLASASKVAYCSIIHGLMSTNSNNRNYRR